jgi:predicted nucleic acid-binding protein
MSVEFFIDTNIFIYSLEGLDASKTATADRLITTGIATGNACISFQVVQECLNTAIRKAAVPLSTDAIKLYMTSVLKPLYTVHPSIKLYHDALDIQNRYRYSFYDSLIISAALVANCITLFSEDIQHGQQIGSLTIKNPFLS